MIISSNNLKQNIKSVTNKMNEEINKINIDKTHVKTIQVTKPTKRKNDADKEHDRKHKIIKTDDHKVKKQINPAAQNITKYFRKTSEESNSSINKQSLCIRKSHPTNNLATSDHLKILPISTARRSEKVPVLGRDIARKKFSNSVK